jgi:multiple sugar transport system substrate-binding protein
LKTLLVVIFGALVAFTIAMLATRPVDGQPGKIPLVWVTDANPLRTEQVGQFNRQNPELDLRIDPGNTDLQKVIVQSQAGVGPDIYDYWGDNARDAYIKSGIAWDVTDELKKRGIDAEKEIWPLARKWTIKDGRVYGIPANVGQDAFWFHKDAFDEAGLPYPKSPWKLDELVEIGKKLTKRGPDGRVTQYGFLFDFGGAFRGFLPSFGGDMFDEKGIRCTIDSPEAIADLTFMHDLLYKHKIAPTPSDEQSMTSGGGWGGGAGPQAYFRKKMGAIAYGGRWWLAQLRDDVKDRGFKLGAVEPPIAKFPRFASGGTRACMINSQSPRREQALEFLVYLMGKEYNVLLNDQADALSGVRSYAYTERYMKNPEHPEEDYNAAWRNALEMGVMLRTSPYVTPSEVDTFLNRQLDLVKLNQKQPAAALRDAARDINESIRRTVQRDAKLRESYIAAGGTL